MCPPPAHPRQLTGVITAARPTKHAAYGLMVEVCTQQMLALHVLTWVPVPQAVYSNLPGCGGREGGEGDKTAASPSLGGLEPAQPMPLDAAHPSTGQLFISPSANSLASAAGVMGQGEGAEGNVSSQAGAVVQGRASGGGRARATERDLQREMVAVAGWCRRRLVWEKLLVQLQVGRGRAVPRVVDIICIHWSSVLSMEKSGSKE